MKKQVVVGMTLKSLVAKRFVSKGELVIVEGFITDRYFVALNEEGYSEVYLYHEVEAYGAELAY